MYTGRNLEIALDDALAIGTIRAHEVVRPREGVSFLGTHFFFGPCSVLLSIALHCIALHCIGVMVCVKCGWGGGCSGV